MPGLTILDGCCTLQLSKEQNTLVDETDATGVGSLKWCAHKGPLAYYAVRRQKFPDGKVRHKYLHRTIADPPADLYVDHKNGDSLDNRRSNLRLATHRQNHQNRRRSWGNSRFKGVTRAGARWWQAKIRLNGKRTYLGCFDTQEAAARAYDSAAREHFGEFACTNADLYGDY